MNVLPFLLLVAATAGWVLLPLVPAIRELVRPTDAEPLDAVGHDAGDLTIFADGFRDYLARQLPPSAWLPPSVLRPPGEGEEGRAPEGVGAAGAGGVPGGAGALVGSLGDGTPFVQLTGDATALRDVEAADGMIPRVVIASGALATPGGETFLLELLARDTFRGGAGAVYRAVLGERDVSLGDRSEVLRWAHAAGDLRVGRGSALHGRASAVGRLLMGPGVTFRRVRATRVVAWDGGGDDVLSDPPTIPAIVTGTVKLPPGARRERGYTRIAGDLAIPPGGALVGSLVVMGDLTVGDGGRIGGSVKVHGDCTLGDDVLVDGAIVSRGSIVVGAQCHVRGSLVAEREVTVGGGSWIGGPRTPASVSAENVVLMALAQVFGAVTARSGGGVA